MSYLLQIFDQKSERDLQVKVGASNISSLCTRCVAGHLAGEQQPESPYTMGAKIGTAVHEYIERRALPHWKVEVKVTLGEIPGYGVVTSTTDLYDPPARLCGDWKTTTRDKMPHIKRALTEQPSKWDTRAVEEARFKVQGYINQVHLYAMALQEPVEHVMLGFIPRDSVTFYDMWEHKEQYVPDRAEAVWQRALNIWDALKNGKELDTFQKHELCWTCNNAR